MSLLLPILFGLQNGTTAKGGAESVKDPLGQVSKDQPKPSALPLPPAFSQIFREQEEAFAFFNKLETPVLTRTQPDRVTHALQT